MTNMGYCYRNCFNLTGNPVCSPNTINFFGTYGNCYNLSGDPVCGNNVTTMAYAYYRCYNLTGPAIAGNKVTNMWNAYFLCNKLGPSAYIFSNNVTNAAGSFSGRNSYANMINIYVHKNSTTLNTFLINNNQSIAETSVTWANSVSYYTCSYINVRIYPVDNVAQVYRENELSVATYTASNANVTPVFNSGFAYTKTTTDLGDGTFKIAIIANTEKQYPSSISFKDQANLLSVTKLATNNVTNMDYMFANCTGLTPNSINTKTWNTSKVISASHMFDGCNNIK